MYDIIDNTGLPELTVLNSNLSRPMLILLSLAFWKNYSKLGISIMSDGSRYLIITLF